MYCLLENNYKNHDLQADQVTIQDGEQAATNVLDFGVQIQSLQF